MRIIYRSLADDADAIKVQTALIWRRNGRSPAIQEFIAVAREVVGQ